ncbi:hypothetical protein IU500_06685 [Nocardia terpenica]|uniref:DUF5677 domain-containing protein n=1 Tax=Nocardia terpenica TaxID=455432 RepID=UPI001893DE1F|nr:DUF5677 domain-containing protein [Nocardia terpenica]MBF6060464.1 hypothetical protein [Nocardia terpenica]MBF6103724.1 hypothetical protein [Nocardia terpenica]MBF6111902.1 hypothetical protein [Nocardia terpenica]MBF6117945.1 hypothetical protein [Nocardia terpenica]MBF6155329.1 hypothetical protein [Nocardia terpenica]
MNVPKPNQNSGPVAGHVRKGRVFKSPLAATGVLRIENWIKPDFPDLLWPALVLAERGNDSIRQFVKWQKAVQDALAHHGEAASVAELLDGRLTHLARLAERFPEAAEIVVEEADRHGLLSASVRRALASYPFRPAPWLVGDVEITAPEQPELELIRDALISVLRDGHREALIKCMRTWSTVQAGTFRSDAQTIEILKNYPRDLANRAAADSLVRASWGAHKAWVTVEDSNHYDEAIRWARVFWGANSMTSRCIRKRELVSVDDAHAESLDGEPSKQTASSARSDQTAPAPMPKDGEDLRGFTMDVLSSFVEALENAPAHLYENERQEVVSGLVARAGRDLIAVLGAPALWCLEHGAHVGRMLVETKVYLHWMAQQEPTIYRQFQEYGAGKAKLYARIVDEVPVEARTVGFAESIEELKRLSHNHDVFDHRTVDTRDTFAEGKSIRAMAEEAGLLDFYRQAYSLSSGVAHSEWWSVETHAMEPCLNVLHGMHQIPSMSLNPGGNVELAASWVDQFYSLVREGLRILGTDNDAVTAAFAWLNDDDDPSTTTVDEGVTP